MKNSILALEQIYIEYYPRIHRYLIRMIGPKEAEDLAQEVFIKAGCALDTFHHESRLSTWLYRIATNTALDRMREPSYRREIPVDPEVCGMGENDSGKLAGAEMDSETSRLPTMEEKILREAGNESLQDIICRLPDRYLAPLVLSQMEDLRNQEIAEILGLSPAVLKGRLQRGRARLKKELLKACQIPCDERNEKTCDPKEMVDEKNKQSTL